MDLHRTVKDNEYVCRTQDLGSYAQGQGHNQVAGQNLFLSNNSKTTEANFTKLYGKIKHNEKVCRVQELGSCAQGQNRVSAIAQKLLKQI